ncbi:MAG: hypothetical protein RMN25_06120 [Anaerolineae bacterium]|nr:hypothetical protein [Thermoflexales bacterium]MDW8407343.1 hypothetical protein [Anaerolineae bacterium]
MVEIKHAVIHVVDGEERGESPQVWVQPAGKRTTRPGETLIAFLDLPAASPSMCTDILRALSDGYWRAPGGMTTALRLAIKLAHDRLVELNRGAPTAQQAFGSLSCAVVNAQSVVIAQSGPAIAYARSRAGAFERIEPAERGVALGGARNPEPTFTHFAWQAGDVFVLTGAGSCVRVSDALIEACMSKGDPRMVAGYLNANVKQGTMVGVVLSVEGAPAHDTDGGRPTLASGSSVSVFPGAPSWPLSSEMASTSERSRSGAAEAGATRARAVTDAAAESMSKAARHAARSVQRSLRTFGSQLLPASTITQAEQSRAVLFGLAAIAVLLPIVVALAVSVLYFQFSGEAERQQLQNAARIRLESARAATEPQTIKSEWGAALEAIATYEAKNPGDTQSFATAKQEAQTQLDKAGQITRITPLTLTHLMPPAGRRRIGASALGVYMLDTGSNSAEYYVLNAERNTIIGKPAPLSFASSLTPGRPLFDITWATPSSNRWRTEGSVLFGNSVIYEYNLSTNQVTPIELPAVGEEKPIQIASGELYNDTIYLLDIGLGQIWRYTYQNRTFTRADTYFRSPFPQLRESADFAIDGAIYVLSRNGAVLKYYNRQPTPFNMTNLPIPFGRVVALAVSGSDQNTGHLFIADAQHGAIFMFNKTGAFLRQYRAAGDLFVNMDDISIDPTSNTLYVATPTHLYSFQIRD